MDAVNSRRYRSELPPDAAAGTMRPCVEPGRPEMDRRLTRMRSKQLILGVDAGGSKTIAQLAMFRSGGHLLEDAIQVLGTGEASSGNCRAVGFDTAIQNVNSAIEQALAQAGTSRSAVDSICIGMAGAGRSEEQTQVAKWVKERLQIPRCRVVGDAPLVLAAACGSWTAERLQQLEGVALISGTGSMAWGCNRAGDEHRCGGWGYLLGDEGSGYWLACQGLQAACRAADGRSPATRLLSAYIEKLELQQASDLIGKLYGAGFDRKQIAALAPLVVELAATDDVAARILKQGADELAKMVAVVVEQLGLGGTQYMLALGGGVFNHSQLLTHWTIASLESMQIEPATIGSVHHPVTGAVYLATT